MTRYVVLARVDATADWRVWRSPVEAHSPEDAVRQAADDEFSRYVAVPERSWKPLEVVVETERRVRVGAAS